MTAVLTGFAVIVTVILAGYIAAATGVVEAKNRLTLNKVAFYIASPALLFTIVARSDLKIMVSPVIFVSAVTAIASALLFLLVNHFFFKQGLTQTTLTAASSGYMNINNIGLPVGMYVIGEITYVPPLILLQVLIFSPIVLAILEASRGSAKGIKMALLKAASNPIIIGSLLGLIVAAAKLEMPAFVMAPLDMIGAAAIPLVLLSFGASFHGQKLLEAGTGVRIAVTASLIKNLFMPALAYLIAGPILQLDSHAVFATTVIAALPTAQNIYNYAATYGQAELVVRNIVFITTFLSLPIIFVISILLGK